MFLSRIQSATDSLPAVPPSASILIVEDDLSIRNALGALLESYDVRVEWAASSGEALELLERLPAMPKLIIVDGRLPDGHGLDLIQDLRGKLPLETEFFLFSAEAALTPELLKRAGVNGFLRKPFDTDRLIELAVRFSEN